MSDAETPRPGGLVLTRKVGQRVLIEHGLLTVEVVSIKGGQVKLRFIGNVKVDREERAETEEEQTP